MSKNRDVNNVSIITPLPSGNNFIGKIEPYNLNKQVGADISLMGEMHVASTIKLTGATFVGTILDTNFWTPTLANSGTAVIGGGQLTLATNNILPGGAASALSTRRARYVAANSNKFRGQIQLGDLGVDGNVRTWGACDGTDGACFMLSGVNLCVYTSNAGIKTIVTSGGFNGEYGTHYSLTTNCTTYEITWTNKVVIFEIDGAVLHIVTASGAPWTSTVTLPVELTNINFSEYDGEHYLYARVASIVRIGEYRTTPIYFHASENATYNLKYGAGLLHKFILNSAGGAGNVATLYDSIDASGQIIAVITTSKAELNELDYGVGFSNGLTLKLDDASAADVTIIYE